MKKKMNLVYKPSPARIQRQSEGNDDVSWKIGKSQERISGASGVTGKRNNLMDEEDTGYLLKLCYYHSIETRFKFFKRYRIIGSYLVCLFFKI